MQRTTRKLVNGRYFMVREEFNPTTNTWDQVDNGFDPNQDENSASGSRTGSYYSGFTQNLRDFQEAKRRGNTPVPPSGVDAQGNAITTGIPMQLRKHVNKVVRQSVPAPGQPARADYDAQMQAINAIENGPGRLTSSSVISQRYSGNRTVAQQQAWNTLVSKVEAVIIRQAAQIKSELNTQYQQEARRIASSGSSDRAAMMADLDARSKLAQSELDKILRTGSTRTQLARNVARSPISANLNQVAQSMIQTRIAAALNPVGDYVTKRPGNSLVGDETSPRIIQQTFIDPKTIGTGQLKLLRDDKGNLVTKRATITPQTRLSPPNGYNVAGSTPSNVLGPSAPGARNVFSKATNDPMAALQQTRMAWQKLLASGNASAGDRDIGQKVLNALNVLEADWKGKNNSGVQAQNLPRIKPAYRIDAVKVANKELQWVLDAEQMTAGRTVWHQGSYSNDPKVKDAMARTGTGIAGTIANPQLVADRQKAITNWLNQTSRVTDTQTGGVTWLKNRALFAGQDKNRKQGEGEKRYTGSLYNQTRHDVVKNFLLNDAHGKSIAAQFNSVDEAIPHVLQVIDYAAKMQAFQAPMEARDIKGSGGKKKGLEAGLTETPGGQVFHTENIGSLRIADLFDQNELDKNNYQKYSQVSGEFKRLGITRDTPVSTVIAKMTNEVRSKYQGKLDPTRGMTDHYPMITRSLERYMGSGGSGSGALMAGQIQQEFGQDAYEGHSGEDDSDLMDEIGSTRYGGSTGLIADESAYSGKNRWSYNIIQHFKNTAVFDRVNRAKIADMYRVMSAITAQGSAQGPSDIALSQSQKYADAAKRSEFITITGLDPDKSRLRRLVPQQILGTTAGGWDLAGSRNGLWGESIFFGQGRGKLGRQVQWALRNKVWKKIYTNPLEDEERQDDMENAHLNREHALLLARINTPQRQYETTPPTWNAETKQQRLKKQKAYSQQHKEEYQKKYRDAHKESLSVYKKAYYQRRISNMKRSQAGYRDRNPQHLRLDDKKWEIPQKTVSSDWRGRQIPSDTHGSLMPVVQGQGESGIMAAYNALVRNTKEVYGLHENGNALGYDKAIEQAERAGDMEAARILSHLQEQTGALGLDTEPFPMGMGVAQSSKLPHSKYLPFNPLFAAMRGDIEQGGWNLTGAQIVPSRTKVRALRPGKIQFGGGARSVISGGGASSYEDVLRTSRGYSFMKDILGNIFGQPATDLATDQSILPDEFRELFMRRAGLRTNEHGHLVDSLGERVENESGDSLSSKQLVSMLHRGFGPELHDWALNAFAPQVAKTGDPQYLSPDQITNLFGVDENGAPRDPALVMAHSLVSSGALSRALGGDVGVQHFYGIATRGVGDAPFGEHSGAEFHRSDRVVSNMSNLVSDLFAFGGEGGRRSLIPSSWGQDSPYGKAVLGIRRKLGLWDDRREFTLQEDASYSNKRKAEQIQIGLRDTTHMAMALRNWVSDMNASEIRQTSDAFTLPPGLLDDEQMTNEDRYQALIMSRDERIDAHPHRTLEEAVPELHEMLTGQPRLSVETRARGQHAPPAYLEYGTILSAMFDAIASQAEVERSQSEEEPSQLKSYQQGVMTREELPTPPNWKRFQGQKKKNTMVRMSEIDESMNQFRNRTTKEIKAALAGGRDASGITMTRAMLAGESQQTAAKFGAKGIGLYSIETTSQARRLADLLKRAKQEYNGSTEVGFSPNLLREFADLFNLDYDIEAFTPHVDETGKKRGYRSTFRNMPSQLIDDSQDRIYVKDRLDTDWKNRPMGIGHSTHLPLGTTSNIDEIETPLVQDYGDSGPYSHVRPFTSTEHAYRYSTLLDANNPTSAISQLMDATGEDKNDRITSLVDEKYGMEGYKELHNLQPESSDRYKNNSILQRLKARRGMASFGVVNPGGVDGFNVADLQQRFQDELARIGLKNLDINVARRTDKVAGMYIPAGPEGPGSITMHVNANEFSSIDDAYQFYLSTLHHEAFHHMSDSGLLSQDQVKQIAGLSAHLPAKWSSDKSLFTETEDLWRPYYEKNNPAMLSRLHEEHAARVYQSYVEGGGELPGVHSDRLIPLDDIFSGAAFNPLPDKVLSRSVIQGEESELVVQNGKLIRRNPKRKAPSSSRSGMGSGRRGGMPPLPPPPFENLSDKYEFHPDPDETIAPVDKMMQQLAQFASKNGQPLFDVRPGAYKGIDATAYDHVTPDFMQLGGRTWTQAQREFIGAPVIEGAGPLVLTGNPGAGKTESEVARIVHRLRQPGITPETAPILTSFAHVTLDETQDRFNKLLRQGLLDKETVSRYFQGGGVTTIHGLGMKLLSDEHLGWGNVFGTTSRITRIDGKDVFGKAGDDIRVHHPTGTLMDMDDLMKLKGVQGRLEQVNGKWRIRKGQSFDRYEQASKERQVEMFRESLHELWHTDLAQSGYDVDNTDIMRFAAGSMPFLHTPGGPTIRRGIRGNIADRDRSFVALQAEMKATGEDLLWKNVQMIAETGVTPQMAVEFFNPASVNPRVPDELAGYNNEFTHNKGEMWLAAKVYAMMDERAQRGSIQGHVNREGVTEAQLVRNYMPWDLVNKPLQYIQSHTTTDLATGKENLHPGIANALHGILGREFIVSEGQDANLGQLALIKALAQGWHKVALSGDPKQDLYGWRGGTRRWMKLAAEAAKKSGSYINLAETFRFTGGMTDYINQLLEKTTFTGKHGEEKRLIPEAPLKAMGDLAHEWQAGAIAVNIHPYGAEGELGGPDWEHEVMAQQVRHMMGMGVAEHGYGLDGEEFSLNPHQRAAIHKAVAGTGVEAGNAIPEDFLVTTISNEEVAQIVKKYRARGINAMAKFSNDKLDEWQGLSNLFKAFDTDDLKAIKANRAFAWFAQDDEGKKILKNMRGGDAGIGRYRMTENAHDGVENLIDDVLKAREYLDLPHNLPTKPDPETGLSSKDFVVVGTIPGLKGKGRTFVQIPNVVEKNFKMKMAGDAVEARENFSKLLTALTRGSQAFMYGSNTTNNNERRKGKNVEHAWFRAAKEFAATNTYGGGEIQPIHIGEDYRPMRMEFPVYGKQRTLAPTEFYAKEDALESRYAKHLREDKMEVFARGGVAKGGQIVVGEGGQEEMIITKDGAKTVRGTHILDVDKMGGMVEVLNQEQIKAAQQKGRQLASEIMHGLGETTAYRGYRRSSKPKGAPDLGEATMAIPDFGQGTLTHFGDTQQGELTARDLTRYLKLLGLDATSIHDPGKGYVVQTKTTGEGASKLAKMALTQWGNEQNTLFPDFANREMVATKGALDRTHKAYAGKAEIGDLGVAGSSAYAKTSRELQKLTEPVSEIRKKLEVLRETFGTATDVVGKFNEGLRKGTTTLADLDKNLHKSQGFGRSATSGDFLQTPSESLKETTGVSGPQVRPAYNSQGHLMVHNPATNQMERLAAGERPPTGYRRQLTGDALREHQASLGMEQPQPGRLSQIHEFAKRVYFDSYLAGAVTGGIEKVSSQQTNAMQAIGQQQRATYYAMSQGNMLPDVGSATFSAQAHGGSDFIQNQYSQDRKGWQKLGITAADYAQNAGTFLSMGGHGFSDATIAGAQAAAAKETGDKQAKAFLDYLNNSSEGKAMAANFNAANKIAFAGQSIGVSPEVMMKATVGFGNASGVTGHAQDAAYSTATAGQILKAAANSTENVNDFIVGAKYVLSNVAPMLTGNTPTGQAYSSPEALGLSLTNPDGSKKTPDQLQKEVQGQAKTAEVLSVLSAGGSQNIGMPQMSRAYESLVQTQYSMNAQQSWLYAKETGVVDKNDQLTGVYTSNPQVYQEATRRNDQGYQLQQMQTSLDQAKINVDSLNVEGKSIALQTQSVTLESQKFAEMAPIQKQTMIDQQAVQNLGYAQSLRQQQFAVSLQPEEAQVFSMQQQQQRDDLARQQRSVAASRAYEDALYGSPGADRSYNAFTKSQQNALAQSQGGQNVGQYVQAVTQGVGLEAAQTYEGINYSRTMLALGQSNLNTGAAYAAQMQHLNMTQGFAEEKFGLDSSQRKTEREIQDESLKQQADLLPVVQDLEKKRFDEQQRQTRESLDLTMAQGKVLNDSNAAFDINLKYYDQEVELQKTQYGIQKDQLDIQARLNEVNKISNKNQIDYLVKAIPLLGLLKEATEDWMNGFGPNKGNKTLQGNNPNTGFQDTSNFISTLVSGMPGAGPDELARVKAILTGGDATLAPAAGVFMSEYGYDKDGKRKLDEDIANLMNNPQNMVAAMVAMQQGDANAYTDVSEAASTTNQTAETGKEMPDYMKQFLADLKADLDQRLPRVVNQTPLGMLEPVASGLGGVGSYLAAQLLGKGIGKGIGGLRGLLRGGGLTSGTTSAAEAEAVTTPFGEAGIVAPGAMSPLIPAAAMIGGGYAAGRGLDWATGKAFGVNTHHAGADIGTGAGFGAAVGTFLLPGVGTAAGAGIGAAAGAAYWAITNPEEAKKAAQAAYDAAADMFNSIKGLSWDSVKKYARDALLVVGGPFTMIYETWKHWDDVKAAMGSAWNSILDVFHGVTGFFSDHKDDIFNVAKKMLDIALLPYTAPYDFLNDHKDDLLNAVNSLINTGVKAFTDALGWFTTYGGMILDGVDKLINGIVGTLKSVIQDSVGKIPYADHVPGVKEILDWSAHAEGGYVGSGLALVGEQGPELVALPKGTIVSPASRTIQEMRQFAPTSDIRSGHHRSILDKGNYDPRFTLHPETARNITNGSHNNISLTINIASGATIDEAMINKLKTEVISGVRKVIEET